ncbi:50S ribosome-binding GTPase [Novymonas esmeraldas]|uniref:50S ribosome-binding GTPase n=1 Tax=Novymonas esmeraldas TaxID=1808958 RepID=A0AAW0ESY6_9TRYP
MLHPALGRVCPTRAPADHRCSVLRRALANRAVAAAAASSVSLLCSTQPCSSLHHPPHHDEARSSPWQGGPHAQLQRQRQQRQHRPAAVLERPPSPAAVAARWSIDAHGADLEDDVVLDTPASLLPCMSARGNAAEELQRAARRARQHGGTAANSDGVDDVVAPEGSVHAHPASRGVGQDVIDLVTDAFTAQREAAVAKRREVLYELTHPNPMDYTYKGKLVPPPPLSFGQVTEDARSLGNKMMLGQTYSLVRQSGTRATDDDDVHGNVNTTHASCPGTASSTTTAIAAASPASRIETGRVAPYRRRAREANIFRDHNYFFEVTELYQEVVLVGRACAGKSSLLNALLGQRVAKTSSTPNTTRKISFYQSVSPEQLRAFHAREHHNQLVKLPGGGLQLTFVDLPGYGIEGMSDKWRDAAIELTDAYFGVRRSINTALYCMDCERGLTKTDVKYLEWIENVHGVCFVVLTKCDSVPHSRICSVMQQVYTLITKHRRKYRKVFPFILPVSAKDGTNVEVLRGLITETSGMLPGDRLRDLLHRRKEAVTQAALLQEAGRIDAARQVEREQARAHFQLTSRAEGCSNSSNSSSGSSGNSQVAGQSSGRGGGGCAVAVAGGGGGGDAGSRRYVLPLSRSAAGADAGTTTPLRSGDDGDSVDEDSMEHFPTESSSAAAAVRVRRERRERFLAWRRAHPLGSVSPSYEVSAAGTGAAQQPASRRRYRLNTGLDNPLTAHAVLELPADAEHHLDAVSGDGATTAAPSTAPPAPPPRRQSSIIGLGGDAAAPAATTADGATGAVSHFLDVVAQYGGQRNVISSAAQRRKEERWRRGGGGGGGMPRGSGGLLAEDASGRLSPYKAGKPCGPALVSVNTDADRRQAEWRAEQLKRLLTRASPEAPWTALHKLRRTIQSREEAAALAGMRRKEAAAYVRNAGRVTASFEKFEGEVTAAKYMNEVRQAPTLRSQQQMHLNATAKINYRSMPPGLWKRYGERDTYWPTPRVLGRLEDESHKR